MPITTEKGINSRIVNVVGVQMQGQETGLIQVIRTPKSIVLDAGIKTKMTQAVDPLGRLGTVDRFVTDFDPMLEINMDGTGYELFRIGMNRRTVADLSDLIQIPIRRQVLKASYDALPVGSYGSTLLADAVATGSAKFSGGTSVALVQQPFTTFVPATPTSFAIGASGALKFSTDLVTARAIVELSVSTLMSTESMSEQDLDYQKVTILCRNTDDSLTYLYIPNFQINPEGSKIDSAGDTHQIKGSILSIGGCEPFTIKNLPARLACQE